MIIDSHSHLGSCRVFDLDTSEQELLSTMANNGITTNIVQPYPGAPNVKEVHNRIGKLAKENPGKIFGLASLNPHMNEDEYNEEVERVVKDLGFVAVKIHTIGHAVNPLGRSADKVFKAAKKLGIPVMVHTGPGVPFSLPS
ncbi:MAG: amidohydrolase family protein, partial [Candidatus Bathyarchaeia archaeon]